MAQQGIQKLCIPIKVQFVAAAVLFLFAIVFTPFCDQYNTY